MENFINYLKIKNFKSIKKIDLQCKRINLFIGKPNVGKSNILEALSLFCIPNGLVYQGANNSTYKIDESYIRYEIFKDLFYFSDIINPIELESNIGNLQLINNKYGYEIIIGNDNEIDTIKSYSNKGQQNEIFDYIRKSTSDKTGDNQSFNPFHIRFSSEGLIPDVSTIYNYQTPIRKYQFKKYTSQHEEKGNPFFANYLSAPHGNNLFALIQTHSNLRAMATDFFKEYNLKFVLNRKENIIEIRRSFEDFDDIIPFSLTADTLQRIIFHLAAIESNQNSILIFEEPEAHSFPPYISQMADKMIESKTNQFFIATHSPYLLNEIIEKCPKNEVAVFVCSYDKNATQTNLLTQKQLSELSNFGIDIFYNIESYE